MLDIANIVKESMKHFQTAKANDNIVESVKGILVGCRDCHDTQPFMEVHRKYVVENQFAMATYTPGNVQQMKFQPHWFLLFTDMLFIATGECCVLTVMTH